MNKKTIIFAISAIIILIAIIIIATFGFNKSKEYGAYTRIIITMTEDMNKEDVDAIVEDVVMNGLPDRYYKMQETPTYESIYTDEFKDTISIKTSRSLLSEEIQAIKDRLNEKYTFEEDAENITIIKTGPVELYDIIKAYIKPVIISFVLIALMLIIFSYINRKNKV